MAEEPRDPEEDGQEEDDQTAESLDQDQINEMLREADPSEADNLEALLDDLGPEEKDEAQASEEPSEMDQMESMLEEMESDEGEEENFDDVLYQATLADAETARGDADSDTPAPEDETEESEEAAGATAEDKADALDDLAALFDDEEEPAAVEAAEPAEESAETDEDAEAVEDESISETEDLDALLQGLDGDETELPAEAATDEETAQGDEDDSDVAETVHAMEEAPSEEEVAALDDDEVIGNADEDPGDAVLEEEETDVDPLLEELDEASETVARNEPNVADEVETIGGEKSEEVANLIEPDEYEADVADLLEDLDKEPSEEIGADETTEETEEVAELADEDLTHLLEDLGDEEPAEEVAELTDAAAEVTEEVAELVDDAGGEEDLTDLLDDLEEGSTDDAVELEGDPEVLEESEEDSEFADAGVEEDVSDLLENLGEEAPTLEVGDLDTLDVALDEDVPELVDASDEEEDLTDLVADLEDENGPTFEVDELADETTVDILESDDEGDLTDLIDTLDEPEDATVLDADEETVVDALDADEESLDNLLGGLEEEVDLAAVADEEEVADLDDLLDDLDTEPIAIELDVEGSLEEEPLEAGLSVGVEDEVAHLLATGKEPPDSDGSILDDFKSVQADLESEDEGEGGTILIVDADPDTVGVFQDALVEGNYEYAEVTDSSDAQAAIQSRDIDLVLVNLDQGDGLDLVSELAGPGTPDVPIVASSEHSERIEQALQNGANDHFTRPVSLVDLEYQIPLTVAALIRLKRAERALAGIGDSASDVPTSVSDSTDDDLDSLLGDDLLDDNDFSMSVDDDEDTFSTDDLTSSLDDDLNSDDLDLEDSLNLETSSTDDDDRLVPLSDQSKMARERSYTRKSLSSVPMFIGITALVIALAGVSGLATKYVMDRKEAEIAERRETVKPTALPVIKPPVVQQAGYEMSRRRISRPNDYKRQADNVKLRIRNSVRELRDGDGAWWSPWRVMHNVGASVDVLVQQRSVQDVIDAFRADRRDVEAGLNSDRTVNYLDRVGFNVRGKSVQDLTPRETFEVLSTREIDSADEIVDVLSTLTDRLARDRADRAAGDQNRQKNGTAKAVPTKPKSPQVLDKDVATTTMNVDRAVRMVSTTIRTITDRTPPRPPSG